MSSRALGVKVIDEFTVPLCRGHHRQLHQAGNEIASWRNSKSMHWPSCEATMGGNASQ